jgi:hypothetical protein
MEIVSYTRYGKYPTGIRCYKRKLKAESIKKVGNHYNIIFSPKEGERFTDFIERIRNQANGIISYSFYIVDSNKWFETKLIEQHSENSSAFTFEVYREDEALYVSCLEM